MKTETNGIIMAGKVYEAVPEIEPRRCTGCYFDRHEYSGCTLVGSCAARHVIYRYSPELTEKLNKK